MARGEPRACLACVKLSQNLPVLHNRLADIDRACGHWYTATAIVYHAATCSSSGVENKILITNQEPFPNRQQPLEWVHHIY